MKMVEATVLVKGEGGERFKVKMRYRKEKSKKMKGFDDIIITIDDIVNGVFLFKKKKSTNH